MRCSKNPLPLFPKMVTLLERAQGMYIRPTLLAVLASDRPTIASYLFTSDIMNFHVLKFYDYFRVPFKTKYIRTIRLTSGQIPIFASQTGTSSRHTRPMFVAVLTSVLPI